MPTLNIPANVPPPKSGLEYLAGKLPRCQIPADTDVNAVAKAMLKKLPDIPSDFFTEDCLYRDMLSMTQSIRTIYGGDRARATWQYLAKIRKPTNFEYVEDSANITELGNDERYIFAAFTFDTLSGGLPATHIGFLNIVPGPNGPDTWQVWSMQTLMENIQGHEMLNLRKVFPDPERDVEPASDVGYLTNRNYRDYIQKQKGINGSNTNGSDDAATKKKAGSSRDDEPRRVDVIVVGAGQAGLCTAGYLKALELDAVVVEKNKEIGDNWTNRYPSLYLHTPHRFNDLAFGPTFNDKEYSEWLTAAELKKGYQYYAKRYDLDVWLSSEIVGKCSFDNEKSEWTMKVKTNGKERRLIGNHIVLAIGSGGNRPLMPHYPGMENYKGKVLHSVQWKGGAEFKGKKAIVVGTANTGHDMAESLEEAGADITMIQRDTTYVIPRDFMTGFLNYAWPPHNERSQDLSDRLFWAVPTAASRLMCYNVFNPQFDAAPELFDGLEKAGFACDRRGDFIDHLLVRFGGHYMNHGASEKIVEGKIKVKGKSTIVAFNEDGVELQDGTNLKADVVVFATGFEKDLTVAARSFLPAEIADSLDEFWGIDTEGEHMGAFVPCGVPNLFMTGGGCGHARFFTRLIALQILAAQLGHPVQPYKGTKLAAEE